VNEFHELLLAMEMRRATALYVEETPLSYVDLVARARERMKALGANLEPGSVVVVQGEFSTSDVATLLAVAALGNIAIPVSTAAATQLGEICHVSDATFMVEGKGPARPLKGAGAHPLYDTLRKRASPGLVLFSSGSTGEPKGAVHDFGRLLANMPHRPLDGVIVAFLLFDHIGGINTLLRVLRGGATLVIPGERSPDAVASAIAHHRATVLPTTPSFLAMLLASGALDRYDLSSLAVVTYGTEVMPQGLLTRISAQLPNVKMKQTYGLSEVGILSTQSASNESTWLRLGGDGFRLRVVDGLLEIKSDSAMLGYLNAPSPYTDDGWFRTMDRVEVDGDLYRILGRESEVINVGGLKVFPQEVESAILTAAFVDDCVAYGSPHPLTGQTVAAEVVLNPTTAPTLDAPALRSALRAHLKPLLDPHKVPTRISCVEQLASDRFKKTRKAQNPGGIAEGGADTAD